jgi:hypothetical protein
MEQQHYYATCAVGWATAETREEALRKLVNSCSPEIRRATKRLQKEGKPGFYLWSCCVPLPADAHYKIEWYKPVVEGLTETSEHYVTYCTTKEQAIWTPPKPVTGE